MGQVASAHAAFAQVASRVVTPSNEDQSWPYWQAVIKENGSYPDKAAPSEVNLVACEAVSPNLQALPQPDDDVVVCKALSVVPVEGAPSVAKTSRALDGLQQRLAEQTGGEPGQIQIQAASNGSLIILACNAGLAAAITGPKDTPTIADQEAHKNYDECRPMPPRKRSVAGGLTCAPPAGYGGVPRSRHLSSRVNSTVLKCESCTLRRGQATRIEYEIGEPLIAQVHELIGGGLPLGPNPVIALVPQRFAPHASPALLAGALALRCIDVAASSGQIDFFVPEAEGPRTEKCELRIYALMSPDGSCHQVGSALACDVATCLEPSALAYRIMDTFQHDAVLQHSLPHSCIKCVETVVAKRSQLSVLRSTVLSLPESSMEAWHPPPLQTAITYVGSAPHLSCAWPELPGGPPASGRAEFQCAMVDQKSGELLGSLLIEANAEQSVKLPLPSGVYAFRARATGMGEWGTWSAPTEIKGAGSLGLHQQTSLANGGSSKILEFHELKLPGGVSPKDQSRAQADQALTLHIKAATARLESLGEPNLQADPDELEDAVECAWDLARAPHLADLKGAHLHQFRTALRQSTAALQAMARTQPTRFISREARWSSHESCDSPSTPRPSRQRKGMPVSEQLQLTADATHGIALNLRQLVSGGFMCTANEVSRAIMDSWELVQKADVAGIGSQYPSWGDITDEGGVEKIASWITLNGADLSSSHLNEVFQLLRQAEAALHALRRLSHAVDTLAFGRPGGTLTLPKEAVRGKSVNDAVEAAVKTAHQVGIADGHPLIQRAKVQLHKADEYGKSLPTNIKAELTSTAAHCRASGHPEALDILVQRAEQGKYLDTGNDHRYKTARHVSTTLHKLDAAVSSRMTARGGEKAHIRGSALEAKRELRDVLTKAATHGIQEGHVRLSKAKHLLHEPISKEELTRSLSIAISKFDTAGILHQFSHSDRFRMDPGLPELRWAQRTADAADAVFKCVVEHGPKPKSLKARKQLDTAMAGAQDAGISKSYLQDALNALEGMRSNNMTPIRFPLEPAPLKQVEAAAEQARALGVPEKYIQAIGGCQ